MAQQPRTPPEKDDPHHAPESGDKPEADEQGGVRPRRDDAAPDESGRDTTGMPRRDDGGRDKHDGTR